ncbi:MAG: DUF4350 domain-containing protein [Flavobacteriaceae bacterium]|nr:DUF4350 domain-containing protein [Bacteroidia bacterium]NNF75856.1 DUF4350 domain-containing protein [Flavobacteriaceae bacterium]
MNRTLWTYIVFLILLFAGATLIEFSKPKPIDWTKTYNETHRSPFGTFIFFNELEALFPNSTVENIGQTPYEYFTQNYDWEREDYDVYGTYMYIDESMTIDDVSAQELLDYAAYGNDIFISSSYLPEPIKDSLGIETRNDYSFTGNADLLLANSRFASDSINIDRGLTNIYFSELDSVYTTVLGYQRFNKEKQINYVAVDYGSGRFFIHLQPVVFTNYSLLKANHKHYTEGVMAYLEDDPIFFDSRNKKRNLMSQNFLRFILSRPALKWAWLVGLFSLIVFIIFNAKRKQRIVKIIKPNENTTVAFTKTIGNLYYETKDHDNVIDKKITYFLEYIRRVYYLDTQVLDEKFIKHLTLKSGRKESIIKKLINLIAHLKAKPNRDESDLLGLNRAMEHFHNT